MPPLSTCRRPSSDPPKRPVAKTAARGFTHLVVIWAVVSAEIGQTIEVFPSREEAEKMLALVLADEPDWHDDLSVESLELLIGSEN